MRKWLRSLAMVTVLALITANLAVAAPKDGDETVNVLVSFKDGKHAAKELAKEKYEVLEDWTEFMNVALVRVPANKVNQLKKLDGVESVDEEQEYRKMGDYADAFPITWGLQAVKAEAAWNLGAKGQGIKVCVLDTGIDYNHPVFFKNGVSIIKGSQNFINDKHPDARDGDGHGTHVAGTIAAQGTPVWGVAPDVELYIGRVLDDEGYGGSRSVINGVKWCVETVGADIISMSLGGGRPSKSDERAYNKAFALGSLVIAAAGNDGNETISFPAGYANVVSVAAVDSNLNRADFSQYNSDVELAGPGVDVYSSVIQGTGTDTYLEVNATLYANLPVTFAGVGSVTGPLVECGLADSTTSCTGVPASGQWIAMVNRGSITFAAKATNVMAQGATAMIIANNDVTAPDDLGGFTFGTAGNWIPAVSVSYNGGVAIRAGGLGTATVTLDPSDYAYYGGTSMATPHASAVAALAWSAKPTLTNSDIRDILQSTAMNLGPAGRDNEYGYGLIQADAAVGAAMNR